MHKGIANGIKYEEMYVKDNMGSQWIRRIVIREAKNGAVVTIAPFSLEDFFNGGTFQTVRFEMRKYIKTKPMSLPEKVVHIITNNCFNGGNNLKNLYTLEELEEVGFYFDENGNKQFFEIEVSEEGANV